MTRHATVWQAERLLAVGLEAEREALIRTLNAESFCIVTS